MHVWSLFGYEKTIIRVFPLPASSTFYEEKDAFRRQIACQRDSEGVMLRRISLLVWTKRR